MVKKPRAFSARPWDAVYFIYFASHILATVVIDLQAVLPGGWYPKELQQLLAYYATTFNDPFMTAPIANWFKSLIYAELAIQLPFFFIALVALWKDDRRFILPSIVYGTHVATAVWPLLYELGASTSLTQEEKGYLFGFYLPYFLIPLSMLLRGYPVVRNALFPPGVKPTKVKRK